MTPKFCLFKVVDKVFIPLPLINEYDVKALNGIECDIAEMLIKRARRTANLKKVVLCVLLSER